MVKKLLLELLKQTWVLLEWNLHSHVKQQRTVNTDLITATY